MPIKRIPYSRQEVTQADIDAVTAVLRSDLWTNGPQIGAFEDEFARHVGAKYAVAVSSGTAALHIAAMALMDRRRGEVLTSPMTFAASANAVLYCGQKVDFVDIDPITFLLDLNRLEDKLRRNPNRYVGVVPVSFAGYPYDTEALKSLADKYNLWVLEDACHSPGAGYRTSANKLCRAGSCEFTDAAVFSFHPVKHIACGEGGMVTLNDQALNRQIRSLRTHGMAYEAGQFVAEPLGPWYHEMQRIGFNYRMSDIHAALGRSQLGRNEAGLIRRRQIAAVYNQELAGLGLETPKVPSSVEHAYHLYVVQSPARRELYDHLRTKEIYAQVHYIPVYWHPYYQKMGFQRGLCPNAEKYYERCLSLPSFPSLTDEDQKFVIDSIVTHISGDRVLGACS